MELALKKRKSDIVSVSMDLQIDIIDTIIQFLFTDSIYITRKSLSNVKKLFDILDTNLYINDEPMLARIHFIKKVLYCRLTLGLFEPMLILEHTRGGNHDDEIINSIIPSVENGYDLTVEEIKYVNILVSERLKYAYLFAYKDVIVDNFGKLELGDYDNLDEINFTIKESLQKLMSHMRKCEVQDISSQYLDLSPENFKNVITETVNRLKMPTNYLQTGIKYLNEMLKGGFEAGRCYLFLGISGGFKSGILLTIATWIKNYNQHVVAKDPNKTPCVLFISQENSMDETIERLFNITINNENIRNFEADEVIAKLTEDGGMAISDDNKINIKIVYYPNKSISTDDLYDIIDETEEEGQEVICLIHDYVKRIRPANMTREIRLDLANIIDEFTVLAKVKHIPVITASQLNREAMKIIEESVKNGQMDIAKRLGSSNVGESWAMIENTDWAAIINKEYRESDETLFLSIKQIKTRAKHPKVTYFSHPFEKDNEIKLIDDINSKESKSIINMSENIVKGLNENRAGRTTTRKRVKTKNSIDDMEDFDK